MTTTDRVQFAHTPGNPFVDDGALQPFRDGAMECADSLGAPFTLAPEEAIAGVRVAGRVG
jgi:hypothetical protein